MNKENCALKLVDELIHTSPSSGSRVVACGQTDRHGKAGSRSSQFCEGA